MTVRFQDLFHYHDSINAVTVQDSLYHDSLNMVLLQGNITIIMAMLLSYVTMTTSYSTVAGLHYHDNLNMEVLLSYTLP